MGCTQSRIEDEEPVTRCKERKTLMKKAITARVGLATSHAGYTVALKDTGAALSDYGQGEVPDLLQSTSSAPPPAAPLPPPPPPLPDFPAPLLRAASMPEFVITKSDIRPVAAGDTIQEEDDDDLEEIDVPRHDLLHRRRRSRGGIGGSLGGSFGGAGDAKIAEGVESIPPPPPSPPRPPPTNSVPPPPPPEPRDSTWDYFFSPMDHNMPGPSLGEDDEVRVNNDEGYKRAEKVEVEVEVEVGINTATSSSSSSTSKVEKVHIPIPEQTVQPEVVRRAKPVVLPPPVTVEVERGVSGVSNVSLLQILNDLDDKFLKASQGAHQVSKILEANRMHYHSNFADNQGHIDHSVRLMRVLTWNRSIKGLDNVTDANEDAFDGHESLASVLDKLQAWEKKLYDEVKAGELMKIDYERKVAVLNKRKKNGIESESLEKAKAAVSYLHTRYIVDMQSMDSTVSEIAHLRDDHLYPKLVSLVDGMGKMWEAMTAQHIAQMKIVEDLRALDVSDTPSETTDEHHKRTGQLCRVAGEWHSQFGNLITFQKNYILALNGWLKLNLMPIENIIKEKVSSPPRIHRPPIHALLQVWHENLERLPHELARSALSSFEAIIKNIQQHQEDEMTLKRKCEDTRKDLARKTRIYNDKYQKYMESMIPDGMDSSERTENLNKKDPIVDLQIAVEVLKHRLKEEEEDYHKHRRQVREKSLASLKNHLPVLFRAMSDFAFDASGMYKKLVPHIPSPKQSESS